MSDEKLHQLEERILRLEKQNLEIKRGRSGLMVQPTVNKLGQNTEINGNLEIAGSLNTGGNVGITGDLDITGNYKINGMYTDSGGWTYFTSQPIYISSTVIELSGDVLAYFSISTKIKFIQSGITKYFYVRGLALSGSNTRLTLTGGSDYTVANATITGFAFSNISSPSSFPFWFNYAMAWTSYQSPQPAIGNGTISAKFNIDQRIITIEAYMRTGSTTTYGTNWWYFGYPFDIWSYAIGGSPGLAFGLDTSSVTRYSGLLILSSQNQMVIQTLNSASVWFSATAPFTWAAGDDLLMKIALRI